MRHSAIGPCCSRRLTVVRSTYDDLIGPRIPRTVSYRGNRSNLRPRREPRLVMILRIIEPGLSPKLTGGLDWVDTGIVPPRGFIADAVHQSMMNAAERHRELVARLAAQGPRLHEPKMMWVGRLATTEEAGLLGDIAKVSFVAIAAGSGNRERTFVAAGWLIIAGITRISVPADRLLAG